MRYIPAILLIVLAACVQKAPSPGAAKPVAMGGIIPAPGSISSPVTTGAAAKPVAKPAPQPAPAPVLAPAAQPAPGDASRCGLRMVGGAGYVCADR